MKLYKLLKMSMEDYDTYDTVFDACVTVCYIDEEDAEDNYDRFCIELMKKVEVVRIIPDSHLTCEWTKLIRDNMEKFRAFAMEHWAFEYNDEDDFIYAWINEIHYYLAGYVSEDFYENLVELVDSLEA